MKSEYLVSAMLTAFQISNHSHCVRRKAGAVIIARDAVENRPVVLGWGCNGMPSGHDTNCCEIPASDDFVPQAGDPHGHLMTHPDVMHAEIRALSQAGERARGAIVLCTDTPCPQCMEALDAAGIAEFHYLFDYRLMDHLQHATFKISKMDMQSVLNFQHETTNALYERIASEMEIKVAAPSTKLEATMQALGLRDFEGGIKRGELAQIRPFRTRHSVMRSALVAQSLLKGSALDREKGMMFDPSKSVNVPVFSVVEQDHGSVLSALQRWYAAVHGEPMPAGVAGPDGVEVVEPVRFGYCPELEADHAPDDAQAAGDWRTNVGDYFQVEARAVQLNDHPDDVQP